MGDLTICSLNVQGMRDVGKWKKLFKYLKNMNCDVFMLQETHTQAQDVELIQKQWHRECFFDHGDTNSRGVTILFNTRLAFTIMDKCESKEGRYLILQVAIKGHQLSLINIYAPNTDSPEFYVNVFKLMEGCDYVDKIVGGDFNLTLDPEKDRKNCKESNNKARQVILNYMDSGQLTDVWRILNPELRHYTWGRKRQKNSDTKMFARLDFFLVSDSIVNRVITVDHKPGFNTDHSMVMMTVKSGLQKRGRGFWKFNTKLLEDKLFVSGARKVIRTAEAKYEMVNPITKWELVKCELISFCQRYSIEKRRQSRCDFDNAVQKLAYLQHIMTTDQSESITREIVEVQTKIDNMLKKQVQTQAFLSKSKWYQYGERNSKFLGGLSLHLNHLIAERVSAPYRQFGTLPIGIFLSNLVSGQLETSLMTSYCHF